MPIVVANGIEIAYESQGNGPPILAIMGIGASLVHWPDDFISGLAGRGFRVICFDNRDVGLSSKFEAAGVPRVRKLMMKAMVGLSVTAPYTLADMADDAAGLLDALDIGRAHVMGVSMGGMIAQTLAITHPERVASLTSMMSTTGDRRYTVYIKPRAMSILMRPAPHSREESIERNVEFFKTVGGRIEIDVEDIRLRAARSYDRCFYPRGFARHLAAVFASGSRRQALTYLDVPTAVIHGNEDPLVPVQCGRATAKLIPGAKLRIVPRMGHYLPRAIWPDIFDDIESVVAAAG